MTALTATGLAPATVAPAALETRLPLSLKFNWACGNFGVAVVLNSVGALMLFYLTTVVGIAGWAAGVILMVSKLYDLVSDPVAGWLSDRHRSPAGRRRPFLLWGALINTVAIILVFTVPLHGNHWSVWMYVLFVNLIYTTGYSIYYVPLLAMAPEMTDGFHERSVLQGWRVMFSALGTAVATVGSGIVLGQLGHRTGVGGRVVNSAADYAWLSVLFGVFTFAGMITAWRGTRRARFTEHVRTTASWRAQVSSFFGNRPAIIIIGVKMAQLIGIASTGAAMLFMIVEVLRRSPGDLPWIGLPSLAVSFIVTPLLARLSERIGKRGGYLIGAACTGIGAGAWIFAQPGEPLYYLVLRSAITGVAFSANVMFSMSMLNDAIELDALRTGLRREGMYTALYSFVEKFGYALGPAAVGLALSLAGFDKTASITPENAAAVRQATLLGVSYIPVGCAVVASVLLGFYRLDEHTLQASRVASLNRA